MRRLWFSVLLLAASAPAFAADGAIQVTLSNVPAELVLDGFPTGKKPPATLDGVAPGLHRVEIAHGCVAGAVDVDVKEGATVKANLVVKNVGGDGTIRLQGVPENATIFMDDAPVESFEKGIKARCGGHKLVIEANGYESHTEMVTVTTSKWTTVKVQLKGGDLEGGAAVATRPSRPAEPSFDDEEEAPTPPPKPAAKPVREEEPAVDPDEDEGFSDEEAPVAKPTRAPPREELEEEPKPKPKPTKPPPKAKEEEEEEEYAEEKPSRERKEREPREPKERKECEVWFCIGGSTGGAIALVSVFGAGAIGGFAYGGVQAGHYNDAVTAWNNATATQADELTEAQIAAYQNNISVTKKSMILGLTLGGIGAVAAGGTVGIMAVSHGDGAAMAMTWEF